jgi:selenocysteine-specific elongation factor
MPRYLILGTAGHIDHGKTSLVRALTGVDTDRLPEEKRRGITIDIGFARLDLGDYVLGVVDVPGHERFIRNMVAGASGIDLALLVVAADDSVMPQTREHLEILELLGVRHGVIAVTKVDLVESDWLELVQEEIRSLVRTTFLKDAPIVRTSAVTGAGIAELREALRSRCARIESHRPRELFRLPIDRSFAIQGHGTVVTGSVWSGELRVGDEVEWLPPQRLLRVRSLQNHEHPVELVTRGQRAAVNLPGVHHTDILRGHEIAQPGYLKPSQLLSVSIRVLESSPFDVRHRRRVRLHIGTAEVIASVSLLETPQLKPGQVGLAQLLTSEPVMATWGQPFVLRSESPLVTVGGGRVLQPVARRMNRRQLDRLRMLRCLEESDPTTRAAAALWFYGVSPWSELDLCRDAGLVPTLAAEVLQQLRQQGILVELTLKQRRRTVWLHRDVLADLEQRVLAVVEQLHAQQPLAFYQPTTSVAARLSPALDEALVTTLIDRLLGRGELVGTEQAVARKGHSPRLSATEVRVREELVRLFHSAGFSPPSIEELQKQTGSRGETIRLLLGLSVAEGTLVAINEEVFLHSEWERELKRRVQQKLAEKPVGLTVAEIRDLLGTTRKFAVPFCEYLDRIGLTRREGDLRVLAPTAGSTASLPTESS